MKKITLLLTVMFNFSLLFQSSAQVIELELVDISTREFIGRINGTHPINGFEISYRSPGVVPQNLTSLDGNFTFTVNTGGEHYVRVHSQYDINGVIVDRYRDFLITTVTIYELKLMTLDCDNADMTSVIQDLPFDLLLYNTTYDFDLCTSCNYLNAELASKINKNLIDNETYIRIDINNLAEFCMHDYALFEADEASYDFCRSPIPPDDEVGPADRLANPNQSSIDLTINTMLSAGTNITLFDLNGQLVYQTKLVNDTEEHTIDLIKKQFNISGMYIMQIRDVQGVVTSKKVIF